jgi:hypothetical protein
MNWSFLRSTGLKDLNSRLWTVGSSRERMWFDGPASLVAVEVSPRENRPFLVTVGTRIVSPSDRAPFVPVRFFPCPINVLKLSNLITSHSRSKCSS